MNKFTAGREEVVTTLLCVQRGDRIDYMLLRFFILVIVVLMRTSFLIVP